MYEVFSYASGQYNPVGVCYDFMELAFRDTELLILHKRQLDTLIICVNAENIDERFIITQYNELLSSDSMFIRARALEPLAAFIGGLYRHEVSVGDIIRQNIWVLSEPLLQEGELFGPWLVFPDCEITIVRRCDDKHITYTGAMLYTMEGRFLGILAEGGVIEASLKDATTKNVIHAKVVLRKLGLL